MWTSLAEIQAHGTCLARLPQGCWDYAHMPAAQPLHQSTPLGPARSFTSYKTNWRPDFLVNNGCSSLYPDRNPTPHELANCALHVVEAEFGAEAKWVNKH